MVIAQRYLGFPPSAVECYLRSRRHIIINKKKIVVRVASNEIQFNKFITVLYIIREEDEIEIDIRNRKINLNIDQKTFNNRMKSIEKFEPKINKGYLGRYARLVTSANTGAVLK